jgi:peptide deformylase
MIYSKRKLITDVTKLKQVVLPTKLTKERIDEITEILTQELERHKGYGLSTNQLGINDVRACIINVVEPLVLINPRLIKQSDERVVYIESCLSLPKTMSNPLKTGRNKSVVIDTDNLGKVEFGPDTETWEDGNDFWSDKGMLECVCAQHELDHLNGKLITDKDRRYTTTLIRKTRKYGRNERVMVKFPDGKTEFMKYKKALPLIEVGAEIL